jgi:hypothetical protein
MYSIRDFQMSTLFTALVLIGAIATAPNVGAQATTTTSLATSTLRDPFRSPRRAVTARAKAGPPPAAPALTATSIIVSGDKSVATLRGNGRFVVVGVGDWLDGWRVIGVTEGGVSLGYGSAQGTVAHLSLQRYSRSKAGKATSAGSANGDYAVGTPAALPGGDLPLLPESPVAQSSAPTFRANVRDDSTHVRPMLSTTVPRLAPNP